VSAHTARQNGRPRPDAYADDLLELARHDRRSHAVRAAAAAAFLRRRRLPVTAASLELVAGVSGEQAAATADEYEHDPIHVLACALKHSRRGAAIRRG
jgi:hypothetical protein